ncbi:general secretion pathway protein GspG [Mangrovimicrobium sediminis]|uniref:General secretion pathway protein GspG n=1 Tax=Mangrovimicrobium sediminis TaxID=2562682 RepID=A0A4Z0M5K5_9GAMM|nr:type II secretion system protein GspG [Haliea sp. SAOS-164]TGD74700.1 general secretion pathway protein GspG [Haliea sp. SAOS-164]
MPRALCLALALLMLGACSADLDQAKQVLTDSLPIKKELEFRNLQRYPGAVVCGEYSGYTSYTTPKADFAPFVVVDGKLQRRIEARAVKIYCSDDPSATLFELTGVGPFTADNQALAKITADFAALSAALEAYYTDNYQYPTMAQGLKALVTRTTTGRLPMKFPEGGYLDPIPKDPWGNEYTYWEEQWGGTQGHYQVTSLGADGAEGGTGPAHDVSSDQLPYLQHIARIHR